MTTYGSIFYSKETFFDYEASGSDISLTAGLISAVYNLTQETQQQKIEELDLEDSRSIFKELPGEKLFIITVDKRMDNGDAHDMLDKLAEGFIDKYGDIEMDGLILSDFEPVADEIVEDQLWHNTTVNKIGFMDYVTIILLALSMAFYPFWLLGGEHNIVAPLEAAYDNGIGNLILHSLLIGVITVLPGALSIFMLRRYKNPKLLFRYIVEFITRPTRGSYAEGLPRWFVGIPFISGVLFISVIYFGRGIQYSLKIITISQSLLIYKSPGGFTIFYIYLAFFLFLFFLTWYVFFPSLVGVLTGNMSKKWLKSSSIVIGSSIFVYVPAQFLSGYIYSIAMNFHPDDRALFPIEADSLAYLFIVILPTNLFLFLFIYFLGIGMNQLVRENREKFPIAFGIGLFLTMALQQVIFWFFFKSGLLGFVQF
jgi:hypothetical protein